MRALFSQPLRQGMSWEGVCSHGHDAYMDLIPSGEGCGPDDWMVVRTLIAERLRECVNCGRQHGPRSHLCTIWTEKQVGLPIDLAKAIINNAAMESETPWLPSVNCPRPPQLSVSN